MGNLINIGTLTDTEIVEILSNNNLTIYEDIQGSKIFVNIDNDEIKIKTKKITNEPINSIDMVMQKLYNDAFSFFEKLSPVVKSLISKNWWFGFEYFDDEQPANIEYNRTPKNKLVLTSIYKGNKFSYTHAELAEYARLFDCDVIPIIFQGVLDTEIVTAIKSFLNVNPNDLEYIFNEKNFAYFFYKLLNPRHENSFLMDNDFNDNLERIIIKIEGYENVTFTILNPLYERMNINNITNYTDIYSQILIHFLTYCQTIDLKKLKLNGQTVDDVYIYAICRMFNTYIEQNGFDLDEFDFVIADFFNKEKFKLNTNLIPNKTTIKIIDNNPKYEYIFKCILSSFNKKKKNPIGVLDGNLLDLFNSFVDNLMGIINLYIGIKKEQDLSKLGLANFDKFFKIKYDKDSVGNVYLQKIEKEIENTLNKKSKDKTKSSYKGFNKNNTDDAIGFE